METASKQYGSVAAARLGHQSLYIPECAVNMCETATQVQPSWTPEDGAAAGTWTSELHSEFSLTSITSAVQQCSSRNRAWARQFINIFLGISVVLDLQRQPASEALRDSCSNLGFGQVMEQFTYDHRQPPEVELHPNNSTGA